MRRRTEARPVLESMESKFLLSAQGLMSTAMVARLPLSLAGGAAGHYTAGSSIPDAGSTFTLSGSGRVGPLGRVGVSGQIGTTGFIATGHAGGTLTLSGARGSVTLRLEGPEQPGFSGPPSAFTYTVLGGTGAFAASHGSGQMTIGFVASPSHGTGSLHDLGSGRVSIQFG